MNLIYLASPYSHRSVAVRRKRFRAVRLAAAHFMQQGLHIYSPIVHGHTIWETMNHATAPQHSYWIETGLDFLSRCNALYVLCLAGWDASRGIQAELQLAYERNLPTAFYSFDPIKPIEPPLANYEDARLG